MSACVYIYIYTWWILDDDVYENRSVYLSAVALALKRSTSYDFLGDHQVVTWLISMRVGEDVALYWGNVMKCMEIT